MQLHLTERLPKQLELN